MKISNECIDAIKKLNLRIDDIEKLLKLLLINDLVEDTDSVLFSNDFNLDSDVRKIATQFGLEFEGARSINEIEVLIFGMPDKAKITIKDVKQIYLATKFAYPDVEPVFMYKTINGMQRKRIMQENISFGVEGKELHVINRGKNR